MFFKVFPKGIKNKADTFPESRINVFKKYIPINFRLLHTLIKLLTGTEEQENKHGISH